ncbi:hypothetical protein [Halobacillus karajensis]|uniref:hypothetical protein n=1 Tax=Halobacillus karajensis TaxID=195088 RepID=UPI00045D1CA7|nr:hypothetical protein [Halobacillus karajensis]CDQ21725.1 hypothetical protein BN982_04134 [Halobacillus karajensis]
MSLFTARGEEANGSSGIDLKNAYIRLKKDQDSAKVRLLSVTDQTVGQYKAHNDYKKNIYTAPCIEPLGEECPYCVALNSGVEGWEKFYPKKRMIITFVDLETGKVKAWDASGKQGESVKKQILQYEGNKDQFPFKLVRNGEDTDTSYSLMPILSPTEQDTKNFEKAKEVEVPEDFLDSVLIPKPRKTMIANLANAGFPVEDFFSADELPEGNGGQQSSEEPVDEEPEEIGQSEIDNM